ncbi:MAG: aldehyde dehydrogenase family protein [Actinobacteria bacterium]|nr:aldehyde dehydrogenase family protein [Actinomycetota bacterium]
MIIGQARGEVAGASTRIDHSAGQARVLHRRSPALSPTAHDVVLHGPVGVVAASTPWSYPLNPTLRDVAPALAASSSVVVALASSTSAILIAAPHLLAAEPELPEGVITAAAGPGSSVGDRLSTHPDVDLIAFTEGLFESTETTHRRRSAAVGRRRPDRPPDPRVGTALPNAGDHYRDRTWRHSRCTTPTPTESRTPQWWCGTPDRTMRSRSSRWTPHVSPARRPTWTGSRRSWRGPTRTTSSPSAARRWWGHPR